jgi:hypothetical protein
MSVFSEREFPLSLAPHEVVAVLRRKKTEHILPFSRQVANRSKECLACSSPPEEWELVQSPRMLRDAKYRCSCLCEDQIVELLDPRSLPQEGDILWVREPFAVIKERDETSGELTGRILYQADEDVRDVTTVRVVMKQGIKMFRAFSRIDLRITQVRLLRLHQISEESVSRQGILSYPESVLLPHKNENEDWSRSQRLFFRHWHQYVNSRPEGRWKSNPWVRSFQFQVSMIREN